MGIGVDYKIVEPKYRTKLRGSYSPAVTYCEDCNESVFGNKDEVIQGFANWRGQAVCIWECPKCFAIHWHHATETYYETIKLLLDLKGRKL